MIAMDDERLSDGFHAYEVDLRLSPDQWRCSVAVEPFCRRRSTLRIGAYVGAHQPLCTRGASDLHCRLGELSLPDPYRPGSDYLPDRRPVTHSLTLKSLTSSPMTFQRGRIAQTLILLWFGGLWPEERCHQVCSRIVTKRVSRISGDARAGAAAGSRPSSDAVRHWPKRRRSVDAVLDRRIDCHRLLSVLDQRFLQTHGARTRDGRMPSSRHSTALSSSSDGATCSTRPQASAVAASITSPVSNSLRVRPPTDQTGQQCGSTTEGRPTLLPACRTWNRRWRCACRRRRRLPGLPPGSNRRCGLSPKPACGGTHHSRDAPA